MDERLFPAIVAVGYDRADSLRRLLMSIEQADYPENVITLVVSLDYSDKTEELEQMAHEIGWSHGELIIRKYEQRQGLRNHILQCGDLALKYGAVIVLEDDLIVSKCFYNYVVQALDFYGDNPCLAGISLYSHAWNGYANYQFMAQKNEYDAYLGQFSISWGQCWTCSQWEKFREWYSEREKTGLAVNLNLPESMEHWGEQSWGKYFAYYIVEQDLYYVIPYTALSTNCSEQGEHNRFASPTYQVMMLEAEHMRYRFPTMDKAIRYDMFFERVFGDDFLIHGISAKDICIDLNGLRRDAGGRRYILTCQKLADIAPVCTYGLCLRPIEENIISETAGDGLYLYEVSDQFEKVPEGYRASVPRMRYEFYDHPWRRTLRYGLRGLLAGVKRKLGRA